MKIRILFLTVFSFILSMKPLLSQDSKKTYYFGEPILTDSNSTLMLPIQFTESLFSKGGSPDQAVYSNILFHNFKTDSSKYLFDKKTYIKNLDLSRWNYFSREKANYSMASGRIFYRVMNVDRDKDGRIDNQDPTLLYCSDYYGNHLKLLTSPNENVLDLEFFRDQNVLLIKMQRDKNNDGKFTYKDTDSYCIILDLVNLKFGKKIEIKSN